MDGGVCVTGGGANGNDGAEERCHLIINGGPGRQRCPKASNSATRPTTSTPELQIRLEKFHDLPEKLYSGCRAVIGRSCSTLSRRPQVGTPGLLRVTSTVVSSEATETPFQRGLAPLRGSNWRHLADAS